MSEIIIPKYGIFSIGADKDGTINIMQDIGYSLRVIYFDVNYANEIINAISDCANQIKQDAKK